MPIETAAEALPSAETPLQNMEARSAILTTDLTETRAKLDSRIQELDRLESTPQRKPLSDAALRQQARVDALRNEVRGLEGTVDVIVRQLDETKSKIVEYRQAAAMEEFAGSVEQQRIAGVFDGHPLPEDWRYHVQANHDGSDINVMLLGKEGGWREIAPARAFTEQTAALWQERAAFTTLRQNPVAFFDAMPDVLKPLIERPLREGNHINAFARVDGYSMTDEQTTAAREIFRTGPDRHPSADLNALVTEIRDLARENETLATRFGVETAGQRKVREAIEERERHEQSIQANALAPDALKNVGPKTAAKWGVAGAASENWIGHGQMLLQRGIAPEFDAAITKMLATQGEKALPSTIDRIVADVPAQGEPVTWVAATQFTTKSQMVLGETETGKRVAVDAIAYSFLRRQNLGVSLPGEHFPLAVVDANGQKVGVVAPLVAPTDDFALIKAASAAKGWQPHQLGAPVAARITPAAIAATVEAAVQASPLPSEPAQPAPAMITLSDIHTHSLPVFSSFASAYEAGRLAAIEGRPADALRAYYAADVHLADRDPERPFPEAFVRVFERDRVEIERAYAHHEVLRSVYPDASDFELGAQHAREMAYFGSPMSRFGIESDDGRVEVLAHMANHWAMETRQTLQANAVHQLSHPDITPEYEAGFLAYAQSRLPNFEIDTHLTARGRAIVFPAVTPLAPEYFTAIVTSESARDRYFDHSLAIAERMAREVVDQLTDVAAQERALAEKQRYDALSPEQRFAEDRPLADLGDVAAAYRTAMAFRAGDVIRQDDLAAIDYFRRAADAGHQAAALEMARAYQTGVMGVGDSFEIAPSSVMAARYFAIAAGYKDQPDYRDAVQGVARRELVLLGAEQGPGAVAARVALNAQYTADVKFARSVASDERTPEAYLDRLASHEDVTVRFATVNHPSLGDAARRRLTNDPYPDIREAARRGDPPPLSEWERPFQPPKLANLEAAPGITKLRDAYLAGDQTALLKLANRAQGGNGDAINAVLELVRDEAAAAADALVASNSYYRPQPEFPELGVTAEARAELAALADNPDSAVHAPARAALRVMATRDAEYAQSLAEHENAPAHVLDALAQHPDPSVRGAVGDSPLCPRETLLRLMADPDESVQMMANGSNAGLAIRAAAAAAAPDQVMGPGASPWPPEASPSSSPAEQPATIPAAEVPAPAVAAAPDQPAAPSVYRAPVYEAAGTAPAYLDRVAAEQAAYYGTTPERMGEAMDSLADAQEVVEAAEREQVQAVPQPIIPPSEADMRTMRNMSSGALASIFGTSSYAEIDAALARIERGEMAAPPALADWAARVQAAAGETAPAQQPDLAPWERAGLAPEASFDERADAAENSRNRAVLSALMADPEQNIRDRAVASIGTLAIAGRDPDVISADINMILAQPAISDAAKVAFVERLAAAEATPALAHALGRAYAAGYAGDTASLPRDIARAEDYFASATAYYPSNSPHRAGLAADRGRLSPSGAVALTTAEYVAAVGAREGWSERQQGAQHAAWFPNGRPPQSDVAHINQYRDDTANYLAFENRQTVAEDIRLSIEVPTLSIEYKAGFVAHLREIADIGDAPTQYLVGKLYADGIGVPANPNLAARYFAAAEAGYALPDMGNMPIYDEHRETLAADRAAFFESLPLAEKRALVDDLTMPPAAIAGLATDPDIAVRHGLAQRSDTAPEIIDRLSRDPSDEVRGAAANNRNASSETLARLATSDEDGLRLSVAYHRNTTAETLAALADRDPSDEIRAVAAASLGSRQWQGARDEHERALTVEIPDMYLRAARFTAGDIAGRVLAEYNAPGVTEEHREALAAMTQRQHGASPVQGHVTALLKQAGVVQPARGQYTHAQYQTDLAAVARDYTSPYFEQVLPGRHFDGLMADYAAVPGSFNTERMHRALTPEEEGDIRSDYLPFADHQIPFFASDPEREELARIAWENCTAEHLSGRLLALRETAREGVFEAALASIAADESHHLARVAALTYDRLGNREQAAIHYERALAGVHDMPSPIAGETQNNFRAFEQVARNQAIAEALEAARQSLARGEDATSAQDRRSAEVAAARHYGRAAAIGGTDALSALQTIARRPDGAHASLEIARLNEDGYRKANGEMAATSLDAAARRYSSALYQTEFLDSRVGDKNSIRKAATDSLDRLAAAGNKTAVAAIEWHKTREAHLAVVQQISQQLGTASEITAHDIFDRIQAECRDPACPPIHTARIAELVKVQAADQRGRELEGRALHVQALCHDAGYYSETLTGQARDRAFLGVASRYAKRPDLYAGRQFDDLVRDFAARKPPQGWNPDAHQKRLVRTLTPAQEGELRSNYAMLAEHQIPLPGSPNLDGDKFARLAWQYASRSFLTSAIVAGQDNPRPEVYQETLKAIDRAASTSAGAAHVAALLHSMPGSQNLGKADAQFRQAIDGWTVEGSAPASHAAELDRDHAAFVNTRDLAQRLDAAVAYQSGRSREVSTFPDDKQMREWLTEANNSAWTLAREISSSPAALAMLDPARQEQVATLVRQADLDKGYKALAAGKTTIEDMVAARVVSSDKETRLRVAGTPGAGNKILTILSTDRDPDVRRAVMENPFAAAAIRAALAADPALVDHQSPAAPEQPAAQMGRPADVQRTMEAAERERLGGWQPEPEPAPLPAEDPAIRAQVERTGAIFTAAGNHVPVDDRPTQELTAEERAAVTPAVQSEISEMVAHRQAQQTLPDRAAGELRAATLGDETYWRTTPPDWIARELRAIGNGQSPEFIAGVRSFIVSHAVDSPVFARVAAEMASQGILQEVNHSEAKRFFTSAEHQLMAAKAPKAEIKEVRDLAARERMLDNMAFGREHMRKLESGEIRLTGPESLAPAAGAFGAAAAAGHLPALNALRDLAGRRDGAIAVYELARLTERGKLVAENRDRAADLYARSFVRGAGPAALVSLEALAEKSTHARDVLIDLVGRRGNLLGQDEARRLDKKLADLVLADLSAAEERQTEIGGEIAVEKAWSKVDTVLSRASERDLTAYEQREAEKAHRKNEGMIAAYSAIAAFEDTDRQRLGNVLFTLRDPKINSEEFINGVNAAVAEYQFRQELEAARDARDAAELAAADAREAAERAARKPEWVRRIDEMRAAREARAAEQAADRPAAPQTVAEQAAAAMQPSPSKATEAAPVVAPPAQEPTSEKSSIESPQEQAPGHRIREITADIEAGLEGDIARFQRGVAGAKEVMADKDLKATLDPATAETLQQAVDFDRASREQAARAQSPDHGAPEKAVEKTVESSAPERSVEAAAPAQSPDHGAAERAAEKAVASPAAPEPAQPEPEAVKDREEAGRQARTEAREDAERSAAQLALHDAAFAKPVPSQMAPELPKAGKDVEKAAMAMADTKSAAEMRAEARSATARFGGVGIPTFDHQEAVNSAKWAAAAERYQTMVSNGGHAIAIDSPAPEKPAPGVQVEPRQVATEALASLEKFIKSTPPESAAAFKELGEKSAALLSNPKAIEQIKLTADDWTTVREAAAEHAKEQAKEQAKEATQAAPTQPSAERGGSEATADKPAPRENPGTDADREVAENAQKLKNMEAELAAALERGDTDKFARIAGEAEKLATATPAAMEQVNPAVREALESAIAQNQEQQKMKEQAAIKQAAQEQAAREAADRDRPRAQSTAGRAR